MTNKNTFFSWTNHRTGMLHASLYISKYHVSQPEYALNLYLICTKNNLALNIWCFYCSLVLMLHTKLVAKAPLEDAIPALFIYVAKFAFSPLNIQLQIFGANLVPYVRIKVLELKYTIVYLCLCLFFIIL